MNDREGSSSAGLPGCGMSVGAFGRREAMPAPPSPSAGELWYAAGESGARRILLLLSTDAEHGLARAAITSTEAEVATDASLAFSADEVGTSFAVVVQTDLVMPVWLRQLGPYVGRLPIPVELIQQAADSRHFAAELEARRGMPLHGPHDTRVAVRDQELEELWEIAGECVAEVEAWDAERAVLDPRLLRRAWTGLGLRRRRRNPRRSRPWRVTWTVDVPAAAGAARRAPSRPGHLTTQRPSGDCGTTSSRPSRARHPRPVVTSTGRRLPSRTDAFDRELIDSALAEALDGGARAVDFYTMPSLVPRGPRDLAGFVAAFGQRQCTVTICA